MLWCAMRNIVHGQIFDENFLMCIATIGAFTLKSYDEACAVLLFYQVGEFFQSYATGKARRSIADLMDIRPDYANLKGTGRVDPYDVKCGDIIVINAGERVPLDGVVVSGASVLDTKAITGESAPRDIAAGDEIISGCVNLTSTLEVRVIREFYDSTVSKVLELVENAAGSKAKTESFITRFARYYTPAVVGAAALLALVPGLITDDWGMWAYRALSFLVVSCPCALVISVPLSFFSGIGAASKAGILIKGSEYLEKLSSASTFVFDKTGTLTKGSFEVSAITPAENAGELLRLAAICESGSSHPIAKSVLAAYGGEVPQGYTAENIAGEGIAATRGGEQILCGNSRLMERFGVNFAEENAAGTVVYVAKNGKFSGSILVEDSLKPETAQVVSALHKSGAKTFMLTGDNEAVAAKIAQKTGVFGFKAGLLPQDKVSCVEKMLGENNTVCFVGDGINDAPVLMRADIGIAMGGVGSDAAIEAADVVLMQDDLRGIAKAKQIAKKTLRIVRQNIIFSLTVKIGILLLSALGLTNMWFAVFGDVGVAVIAILNAMRVK